jgi:hypothetical protein
MSRSPDEIFQSLSREIRSTGNHPEARHNCSLNRASATVTAAALLFRNKLPAGDGRGYLCDRFQTYSGT